MKKRGVTLITAICVIRNEAPYLVQYIEHVRRFCDEVLILDQQSTDMSVSLAKTYADRTFMSPNVGWSEMDKMWLLNQAKNDWVCILDPDERFPEKTIKNIPIIIDNANKNQCDTISFKVTLFWDGIPMKIGNIQQCRLTKKGICGSKRIHTNFCGDKGLITDLPQYHFKDSKKHIKRLEIRQKLDYEQRIKDNENEFLKDVTDEYDNILETPDDIKEKCEKDLKLGKYIELV